MTEDLYAYAPCSGLTELFYADDEETQAEAVDVCGGCPVQTQCLLVAIASAEHLGVWGGLRSWEREQMRQLLEGATEVPPMACREKVGTDAGRTRHRRKGEPVCPPCYDAYLQAQRDVERAAS